jgi:hypothetical protein
MTENGWSKKYTVDVTFLTGNELNQATKTFDYSTYSVYGVVFWDKGQATIIKISTTLFCGMETDKSCIQNAVGNIKGIDQDGDEWKICASDYCY